MDLLRPYLLPLTHNLPHPLPTLGAQLLTPACYNQLILNLNPQPPCLRLAISKLLGLGIITLSSIVKIPQILNLLSTRSARGVSLLSYMLETGSYLITLLYAARRGFPFTAYGETALIAVQNVVVCVLVLLYGGDGGKATAGLFVAGVVAGVVVVGDERWVDMRMLGWLQAGAGLVGVASKGPQIWVNWRQGGTGVLSAFTVCFLSFLLLLLLLILILLWWVWMSVMGVLGIVWVGTTYKRHDRLTMGFFLSTGLHLPRRIPLSDLHHVAGGGR